MTKTLKHGDTVRLASWRASFVRIHTLAGYCAEYGYGEDRMAGWRKRGEPEAATIYAGSFLSSDPAAYRHQDEMVKGAQIIADGELINIEGKPFKTYVMPRNHGPAPCNSDPIHFIPACVPA